MANELSFDQIAAVMNAVVEQATGAASIAPVNTSEFVTVANTALKAGYDPVINAISQVLSRTIFSIRPYNEHFRGLRVDAQKWGNHVRKLNIVDSEFVNDDRYTLENGQSIDQYTIRKPDVLQTNYYGGDTVSDYITIFRDQLDAAFTGPDQFGEFITMVMTNISDRHAQARESMARACIANLVGGIQALASGTQIVNLLSRYNAVTGLNLTNETVMQPANYPAFMKWAYAEIATVSKMLTERSQIYHANVANKPIQRHTPYDRQKVFMLANNAYQINARVLADTYHDNYLRYAVNETVSFWQSIETPDTINVVPTVLNPSDGTAVTVGEQNIDTLMAVIIDEEAAGYTTLREWMAPTPFNARGGYTNLWWHFDRRYWNDFTENAVIFRLL